MSTARSSSFDEDDRLDQERVTGLFILRQELPDHFKHPTLKFLESACKRPNATNADEKLECLAFVMSIDVRHSTRVLEEVRGRRFSEFMDQLCTCLRDTVNSNYGICYQYTGDGILSVFPRFYTGQNAAYWVAKTVTECHEAFASVFDKIRHSIEFVPWGIGLGIGIDWGRVWVVNIVGEYVCVGGPVVSACRMGSGNAYSSLVNQQGYNEFIRQLGADGKFVQLERQSVFVKHKGEIEAFHIASFTLASSEEETRLKPEWARSS